MQFIQLTQFSSKTVIFINTAAIASFYLRKVENTSYTEVLLVSGEKLAVLDSPAAIQSKTQ